MNRIIFIISLLLLFSLLGAQSIIVNSRDNKSIIFISVPFSSFFFAAEDAGSQYRLSINIVDLNASSIYQKTFVISLDKQNVINQASYVFEIPLSLEPGEYEINTILKNPKLGDKMERRFDIQILTRSNSMSKSFVLAENEVMKFIPSAYEQLTPHLKSCYLYTADALECDSIIVKAEIDKIITKVGSTNSSSQFDLLPLIKSGSINNLELRCYSGNIIEVNSDLLFVSNDTYKQRFSHKDQLLQIKYIANQNEWKQISRIAKKDPGAAIQYFWQSHNNSPWSFKNELRELFYERVLKADELFTIHKKLPGWKSDRGRIFIRKGNPDDIVEEAFPIGRYPYVIWYYYKDNTVYRFYDKTGFGNYKLEGDYNEN